MSLIVKGMEMPELEYHRCKLIRHNDGFYLHVCVSIEITDDFETVEEWEEYPLLSVPPHGRLGDLDAAEKTIRPWTPEDEISGCTFDTVKKLMHTLLNNAPTIIPADPAMEGAQR